MEIPCINMISYLIFNLSYLYHTRKEAPPGISFQAKREQGQKFIETSERKENKVGNTGTKAVFLIILFGPTREHKRNFCWEQGNTLP